MLMKDYLIIMFCLGIMYSCTCDSALEKALQFSGANRKELEKVLTHYLKRSEDSLKYKAACFLIENMPGHGWYEGEELEKHKKWIDSTYGKFGFILKATLYEAFFQQPGATSGLDWKEDIQHLDSDFLIKHIDYLYKALDNRPWLRELDFSQFCEYILPYRVGYECPRLWHKLQDSLYDSQVKELLEYDNARFDVSRLFPQIGIYMCYTKSIQFPYRNQIIKYNLWGCEESAITRLWYARLLLCPVSIDFLAAHANKNDSHRWLRVVDNRLNSSLGIISTERGHLGKIYRKTFSHNPVVQVPPDEYVPKIFQNTFYRDVTADYTRTENIKIKSRKPVVTRNGYLCVFNNRNWIPVAAGEFKNGMLEIKDVGCGVVYLPVAYPQGECTGISYPVAVTFAGKVQTLKPDTACRTEIKLEHKAPLKLEVRELNFHNLNAMVEASNDPAFKNCIQVGKISYIDKHQRSKIDILSPRQFRYWRIRASDYLIMAECFLTDDRGKRVYPELNPPNPFSTIAAAFDNDPLTYAANNIQWDMGKSTALTSIECLFQNNGNDIWPGDWYELFYHDGDGWYSLGIQQARDYEILFPGVPANALLWLKNLSRGKEERIFTYEKEEIRFW